MSRNKDEAAFKTELIKEIKRRLPGSFVFHLDPSERQGAPDLLVIYQDRWAMLEGKKHRKASYQRNQNYYIDLFNKMSFARSIFPENREEVLDELERSLSS